MLYIFVRTDDEVGEGQRADLYAFGTRAEADKAWAEELKKHGSDLIEMSMIIGTRVNHWQADLEATADRELNDNDLQSSALEDVDNMADKENV